VGLMIYRLPNGSGLASYTVGGVFTQAHNPW
jgi:hypothetical protein